MMDVNYKNNKRYDVGKKPIRQPFYLTWLIWFLSKFMLMGKKYKIEKINMEGLKPPYLILSNHMAFIDFELTAVGTYPHRVNSVVNFDGYYQRAWLLRWIGSVCTRKFTTDLKLVKNISTCLKRGDVLCLYPEARYSPIGTTAYLPDSLGKLVKLNKVPVVCVVHHGNYLQGPFWNFRRKRKVPFYTTMTKILDTDQIKEMSVDEINKLIRESLAYDEYKYQKDNNIVIDELFRAEGLHKVLYKCPHCLSEEDMASEGTEIYCKKCQKRWRLNEDGSLSALDGDTIFEHVPDWFEYQRKEVIKEIENNTYLYEDEVDVYSLPRSSRFIKLGRAKIRHDPNGGFVLKGHYRDKDYLIQRKPLEIEGLHVEYDYFRIRKEDCFVINTENDSFFCYPCNKKNVTKLAFATEEIFQKKLKEKRLR